MLLALGAAAFLAHRHHQGRALVYSLLGAAAAPAFLGVVAAAQEERFTRRRHDADYPRNAVAYCLREAGIAAERLDQVCFYDKPVTKFARILESHLAVAPRGFRTFLMAVPLWLRQKLWT